MVNKDKIIEGVKLILEGIGEDCSREGLLETPDRIARMYEEIFAGMNEDVSVHLQKRFHVENNGMILEKDILSAFWFTNNYSDAVTICLLAAALVAARVQDETWIYHIWDQEIERPGEDEFEYEETDL